MKRTFCETNLYSPRRKIVKYFRLRCSLIFTAATEFPARGNRRRNLISRTIHHPPPPLPPPLRRAERNAALQMKSVGQKSLVDYGGRSRRRGARTVVAIDLANFFVVFSPTYLRKYIQRYTSSIYSLSVRETESPI